MAELTPAQRQIADAMIAGTFDSVGAPPSYMNPGMSVEDMYRGIYPTAQQTAAIGGITGSERLQRNTPSRLSPSAPGLPNPSPGSGLTPSQLAAMGGWTMDNRTGQLAYMNPKANPAVSAATALASKSIPLPRARPGYAPTSIDIAAINAGKGNKFGLPTHEQLMAAAGGGNPVRISVRGGNPAPAAPVPLMRPATIRGSSTGKALPIGQLAQLPTGGVFAITANGPVKVSNGGGSSAEKYAAAAAKAHSGSGGGGQGPSGVNFWDNNGSSSGGGGGSGMMRG